MPEQRTEELSIKLLSRNRNRVLQGSVHLAVALCEAAIALPCRMPASKPSVMSERELYYRLMNIEIYPEALKDARKLVNAAHKQTEAYLNGHTVSEDDKRLKYTEVCLRHCLLQKATKMFV